MNKTLPMLALLLASTCTIAQVNDTITVKKNFGGQTFYYNGSQLKSRQLKNTLKNHAEAYNIYKSSRAATTVGAILGYTGGFMIGWSLGTAIGGGKPNWAIGGIGAGLTAVSIPFSISSGKKIKKAVNTFNASVTNQSTHNLREMRFQVHPAGVGLAYHF